MPRVGAIVVLLCGDLGHLQSVFMQVLAKWRSGSSFAICDSLSGNQTSLVNPHLQPFSRKTETEVRIAIAILERQLQSFSNTTVGEYLDS